MEENVDGRAFGPPINFILVEKKLRCKNFLCVAAFATQHEGRSSNVRSVKNRLFK